MASRITRIAEAIAGPNLCKVKGLGHRWQVVPSLNLHGRWSTPFKICQCCDYSVNLPTAPPADHPDTMTSGVTAEQAAWLARVDMELTGGAS